MNTVADQPSVRALPAKAADRILAFAWDYLLLAAWIILLTSVALVAMQWAPKPVAWAFGCPIRARVVLA